MSKLKFFEENKTPKSVLQEVGRKKKCVSTFDSVQVQATPPSFQTTCTVRQNNGEVITALGCGSSKKEGEHVASLEMLVELLSAKELISMTGFWKTTMEHDKMLRNLQEESTLVSKEPIKKVHRHLRNHTIRQGVNSVELFNTLARKKNVPMPTYDNDEHLDDEGQHIYTITCGVGDITYSASRSKNREAKSAASNQVLQKLNAREAAAASQKLPTFSFMPPKSQVDTSAKRG